MSAIKNVLNDLVKDARVVEGLAGRTAQLKVADTGSWTLEFFQDGVEAHLSRKSDYPQHDFFVSISRTALEKFLLNPLTVWDFLFDKSFATDKPVMAAMMLESLYPGLAERVIEQRLSTSSHYGERLSVESFFRRILPDAAAHPKFMARIKATYNFQIDGGGSWSLDTSAPRLKVKEGQLERAKCTIKASREDFEAFLNDPVQVAVLISTGRIQVSHPCRARQLLAAIWMPDIRNALGDEMTDRLFANDSCEESAIGELHYTYVEYTPGGIAKIPFVDVDGAAIWQGDIRIGNTAELVAVAKEFEAQLSAGPEDGLGGIRVINWADPTEYVWPNRTLFYQIDSDVEDQDRITDAIAYFSDTNITFTDGTGNGNYVRIKKGDGCSSAVGMQTGEQTMTITDSCSAGNIAHELCHALGLKHEQSRYDRDTYVTIEWDNIVEDKKHNFDKVEPSVNAYIPLPDAISRLADPPPSPADKDRYLVAVNATGAWAGQDNSIAEWDAGAAQWIFTAPVDRNLIRTTTPDAAFAYDGSQWQSITTAGQDLGDYDYGSIMHYGSRFFGKKETTCKKKVTIETKNDESIGQRSKLSDGDKAALKEIYG